MANQTQVAMYKQMAKLEKMIKQNVAEIYACFAKVFYDLGWDADMIEDIFADTQKVWQENATRMDDMITWVSETTGIEVREGNYEKVQNKEDI